jgi:hypothetical protein
LSEKPFVFMRFFGVRIGTLACLVGFVFLQLGYLSGAALQIAGLTWNGLAYLLERLERR